MTIHKSLFIVFIFFVSINIYSQSEKEYCKQWRKEIDTISSLNKQFEFGKKIVSSIEDPLCKTEIYIYLGETIFTIEQKIDSALYFYDKAIIIGKKNNAENLLSVAYSQKAHLLIEDNRYSEALELLQKSRNILVKFAKSEHWKSYYQSHARLAQKKSDFQRALLYKDSTIAILKIHNDSVNLPNIIAEKGNYYLQLSDYENATNNLLLAIELKEKQENSEQLESLYHALGVSYLWWGQYEKAKKNLEISISKANESNYYYVSMIGYLRLAKAYRKLNQFEKGINAIDSSLTMAENFKYNSVIAEGLNEKGFIYVDNLKQYNKAENSFIKAYEILKKSNNNGALYSSLQGLVVVYHDTNRRTQEKQTLDELNTVTEKINSLPYSQQLHKHYSEYYEKVNDYSSSLNHLKKYYSIKDSISNKEIKAKVADLEAKYDTKNKELEIVNLNQEKKEQQQIAKQAEAKQYLYLLVAGFLLFLLGIGAWAFRKLRKQQKELTSTNQIKNHLFSIIAHDLRGMIVPFQRSGKILKYHIDKGNHEKTIELSQALEQNSESLSNMLDNLLNWSLEQMNGYKMNPEKISVEAQLSEIITGYKEQATYKKTTITLKHKEDLCIDFDKGAFHVIFRNLIGNALKYTEKGSICIEFASKNDLFLCSVTDTGVGMSQDQLEHLFTLEEKESAVGTQGEKGTGLGLNLVYRFIKMHHGTIEVSSEKRIGTRFDLRIPVKISLTKDKGAISKPLSA
ncbi:ATP-binding protein [Aquimarina sp. M1]